MKQKCIISGQSGFIGQHLNKKLLSLGYEVTPTPRNILNYPEKLKTLFEEVKPDLIFHLAAYGNHFNQTDIERIVRTNVSGTLNMLKCSENTPYKTFYNFSTSSVTLKKQTVYSVSKLMAEVIGSKFRDVKNIRPYSVYGPGEADHRFIPTVIRALKSGEQITVDESACHDWIYIDDFINALMAGETEIGTGEKTANITIVRKLELLTGKKLNYSPGMLRPFDNENWVCSKGVKHIGIDEGLKKTFEYYDSIGAKNS